MAKHAFLSKSYISAVFGFCTKIFEYLGHQEIVK